MNRQWTIEDFQRTFDSSDKWTCSTYTAGVKIKHAVNIEIQLENCEANNHAEYISSVASKHINWVVNEIDAIETHLASKMTELANDWLQEGEDEITEEDFKARVGLESINISGTGEFDANIPIEDGNFILNFNDDDIFGEHTIELWVHEGYELDEDPGLMG